MITLESIKERYEHLTDAQKELLLSVSAYVHSDNLDDYVERLQSYVTAIKQYNKDADNDAIVDYLKYARSYTFPDVYYLKYGAQDYAGQVIDLSDFYCVSLIDYIDNRYAVQLLNRNFIDYVIDPVRNDAPDVDQYNDQLSKEEAEDFIKEHNKKVQND